jgi:hypothetical protein
LTWAVVIARNQSNRFVGRKNSGGVTWNYIITQTKIDEMTRDEQVKWQRL